MFFRTGRGVGISARARVGTFAGGEGVGVGVRVGRSGKGGLVRPAAGQPERRHQVVGRR